MHISYFFTIFARPMHRKYYILYLLLVCAFTACVPCSVREVQSVVAQADRLWQAGQMYGDSTQLAQAYGTLGQWQWFYADEYAHACYHYGKLLRAKDNPVAAMQAFINATHSHTRDYHILGRVYNNVGDICHLAGEYALSYNMFEQSAEMYRKNGDTLLYYYCLNDMAYELAEQGKKEETLTLLAEIEKQCVPTDVLVKVLETKAVLYRAIGQNDSAIYYVDSMQSYGHICPGGTIIKAQAYDNIGQKDSALILANIVLTDPRASYQNQFNALYIIQHCDSSLCAENISELASKREDIRYYEYEPKKEKNSTAVALLKNDLSWAPDLRWVYAVGVTIVIIGLILGLYVRRKRHQHKLLSQQIDSLSQLNVAAEKQHAQIIQKQAQHREALVSHLETMCDMFANADNFPNNLIWKDYSAMCRIINDNFGMLAMKLQSIYQLPERGIRLCILVLMKVSDSKELASLLFYSESGIRNFKNRVAKKLGTNSVELRNTLINIAINNGSWH